MDSNQIDISGMDKAEVLAALYNASRPQGLGFIHARPEAMTAEQARTLLGQTTYFDYLQGRVMKVELGGDKLDPWGYDRDLGKGAAARAIAHLRKEVPSGNT